VLAYPGCPGKKAVEMDVVAVVAERVVISGMAFYDPYGLPVTLSKH